MYSLAWVLISDGYITNETFLCVFSRYQFVGFLCTGGHLHCGFFLTFETDDFKYYHSYQTGQDRMFGTRFMLGIDLSKDSGYAGVLEWLGGLNVHELSTLIRY